MNKLTRSFLMTGVAVATGLTMAAGPAAATSAAPSGAETSAKPAATKQQDVQRRDRIVGFYRSPRACHKLGRIGVWKENWERYQCFRVWRGSHRGDWALKVYYGWNWHQGGHGHGDRDWHGQKHGNDWQKR
jgi:hypothetical protein